jgi:hypothetical protein
MIYKDHEIYARVAGTYSDLYTLKKDGSLDTSQDIVIYNDDEQIVWYEVEAIDPNAKPFLRTMMWTQLKTLDEAKKIVDRSFKYISELE